MNNLVKAENLVRSFEFGETQIHALDGVDLSINEGEFVVILGPSGAGKTTLLNMIGGIDHPTTGNIIVDRINIKDLNTKQLNEYRKNQVGWVFQFFNIVDSLRAWENVGLALEFQGIKNRKEIKEKSYKILAKVGLEGKELRFPSQLSGGEQQRVAIARALVKNPKLIVADEPTGNLDFVTGQKIAELMQTLNRDEGSTFIVVSHDTSITRYADRIFHLKMGKIEKIIENPNSTENVTNLPEFKKVQE
ncbi:putative ABC transporter ATP-binding protein [Candidatus Lokiarchaeum ossiferum]|uniref:ABC transporter ATP-binding protein n=1 Tax=Candidatus Lokiarchaeum ossiferum TaxID=2951803 RepID=A0ABY6HQQ0_9ARCH|nr:putative ABC transporter ATP-binding protein [Candidatus Lokiarchaeum sp. B-35]